MRTHLAVSGAIVGCLLLAPVAAQQVPQPPTPAPAAPATSPSAPTTPAPPPAAAVPVQAAAVPAAAEGFVWAEGCKPCHGAIYDAWAATKHATTLRRLSADDRQKECIGCHVTGPKQVVMVENALVNGNVQCESCHGAGQQHVAAATGGAAKPGFTKRSPDQKLCEGCHNDKSPHYRGFFFSALKNLVHKVPKS